MVAGFVCPVFGFPVEDGVKDEGLTDGVGVGITGMEGVGSTTGLGKGVGLGTIGAAGLGKDSGATEGTVVGKDSGTTEGTVVGTWGGVLLGVKTSACLPLK